MIILSVDPGEVAGLFVVDARTGKQLLTLEAEWLTVARQVDLELTRLRAQNCRVVAERWTQQSTKQTVQTGASEMIGALRYVCRSHLLGDVELQSRADRMRVPLSIMISLGWNTKSPLGHVRCAARHALLAVGRHLPTGDVMQRVADTVDRR